jgi:hypothetical protein
MLFVSNHQVITLGKNRIFKSHCLVLKKIIINYRGALIYKWKFIKFLKILTGMDHRNIRKLLNFGLFHNCWLHTTQYGHKVQIQTCLHQSSGNGFQWWIFPFLWGPKLSLCLSHSNCRLTPKLLLHRKNVPHYCITWTTQETPLLCCIQWWLPTNGCCLQSLPSNGWSYSCCLRSFCLAPGVHFILLIKDRNNISLLSFNVYTILSNLKYFKVFKKLIHATVIFHPVICCWIDTDVLFQVLHSCHSSLILFQ